MAQSASVDGFPPPPLVGVPEKKPDYIWSTGLCDCFDDCGLCCITCLCPCITFGRIAEIIDGGTTSCGVSGALYTLLMVLTGCQCIYSCFYRAKMRSLYNLPESPCPDCCVHFLCEECGLCQMHRELRNRGFDMKIGYRENKKRMGGGGGGGMMNVPPPVLDGMHR